VAVVAPSLQTIFVYFVYSAAGVAAYVGITSLKSSSKVYIGITSLTR